MDHRDTTQMLDHTDQMTSAKRMVAVAAMIGVIAATAVGCSSASHPPEPAQWRQVDAAENAIYGILTSPTTAVSTPEALFDRLSSAVIHWDEEENPAVFSEDEGTAVFYDYQDGDGGAVFDVFVASGRSAPAAVPGWFGGGGTRVYTCYQLDVSFKNEELSSFHRSRDYGEDLLSCPTELVSALGEGASYREPWIFDG